MTVSASVFAWYSIVAAGQIKLTIDLFFYLVLSITP